MDPEFQRVLLRVLVVGGTVMVIATAGLVVGFRGWEKETQRSLAIVGFAIAFILLACVVFLRWSFAR